MTVSIFTEYCNFDVIYHRHKYFTEPMPYNFYQRLYRGACKDIYVSIIYPMAQVIG